MISWFRFNRAPWGTVYLMQSRHNPQLFKVGYTRRQTITRRAELNRVADDDMKIVATVQMPWAIKCEALLLKRLRRNPFRRRDRRGTEWFYLGPMEDISNIERKLTRAADHIEILYKIKLSWPTGAEIRHFKSGFVAPEKPRSLPAVQNLLDIPPGNTLAKLAQRIFRKGV